MEINSEMGFVCFSLFFFFFSFCLHFVVCILFAFVSLCRMFNSFQVCPTAESRDGGGQDSPRSCGSLMGLLVLEDVKGNLWCSFLMFNSHHS